MKERGEKNPPILWTPEMGPRMRPRGNDNAFICGKTQSGKSELLVVFVEPVARHHPTILIDPKNGKAMRRLADFRIDTMRPQLPSVDWYMAQYKKRGRYPVLRYVPRPEIDPGKDELLDDLLWQIFHRKNMLTVYDETATMADANRYPTPMKANYQQGQEGDNGNWAINQRALDVPKFLISASSMLVSFWMGDKSDRNRLGESGIDWEAVADLEQYEYAAYRHGKERSITIYPPITLKSNPKKEKSHE